MALKRPIHEFCRTCGERTATLELDVHKQGRIREHACSCPKPPGPPDSPRPPWSFRHAYLIRKDGSEVFEYPEGESVMSPDPFSRKLPEVKCHVKLTLDEDGKSCFEIDGVAVPLVQNVTITLDVATMLPLVTFTIRATKVDVDLEGAEVEQKEDEPRPATGESFGHQTETDLEIRG